MEVFKIVSFALVAVIMIIIIKEQKPEMALLLTIIACLGLMFYAISNLSDVILLIEQLISSSGMNTEFFSIILKVTAITYIVEFGKNVCIDAGQSAVANKLEMAGKVLILTLSIPLVSALVNVLTGLV